MQLNIITRELIEKATSPLLYLQSIVPLQNAAARSVYHVKLYINSYSYYLPVLYNCLSTLTALCSSFETHHPWC
jgi:hypothetical protein